MSEFPNLKKPYDFIASLGGIGLIPLAPGTFGSIFAWFVFVIMSHFVDMLIYTICIVFIAVWVCEKATVNLIQKDHKSIVIDELAGMWVALVPVIYFASNQFERIIYACLALVFFRVFDILKPFPISYFDKKYKNGFGIVLDDIIAGIFSGILSVLIVVFLI
tara:strand:+ start:85 stop:570 length:486 start_codon:yes stop_codon:yes gene_type:complete